MMRKQDAKSDQEKEEEGEEGKNAAQLIQPRHRTHWYLSHTNWQLTTSKHTHIFKAIELCLIQVQCLQQLSFLSLLIAIENESLQEQITTTFF